MEQPQKISVEPGSGLVLVVCGRYYDADQGKTSCLLGPVGDRFECWPSPETERIVEESSRKQRSLFRKGDDFLTGQNVPYYIAPKSALARCTRGHSLDSRQQEANRGVPHVEPTLL